MFPLVSCTSTGSNFFLTSPDFLPILIPGTYLRTQRATQQGLHDASLQNKEMCKSGVTVVLFSPKTSLHVMEYLGNILIITNY